MEKRRLEELAVSYCDTFLGIKTKGGDPLRGIICLHGVDEKTLIQFQEEMGAYFKRKGKDIQIKIGPCDEGYNINLSSFL